MYQKLCLKSLYVRKLFLPLPIWRISLFIPALHFLSTKPFTAWSISFITLFTLKSREGWYNQHQTTGQIGVSRMTYPTDRNLTDLVKMKRMQCDLIITSVSRDRHLEDLFNQPLLVRVLCWKYDFVLFEDYPVMTTIMSIS